MQWCCPILVVLSKWDDGLSYPMKYHCCVIQRVDSQEHKWCWLIPKTINPLMRLYVLIFHEFLVDFKIDLNACLGEWSIVLEAVQHSIMNGCLLPLVLVLPICQCVPVAIPTSPMVIAIISIWLSVIILIAWGTNSCFQRSS